MILVLKDKSKTMSSPVLEEILARILEEIEKETNDFILKAFNECEKIADIYKIKPEFLPYNISFQIRLSFEYSQYEEHILTIGADTPFLTIGVDIPYAPNQVKEFARKVVVENSEKVYKPLKEILERSDDEKDTEIEIGIKIIPFFLQALLLDIRSYI